MQPTRSLSDYKSRLSHSVSSNQLTTTKINTQAPDSPKSTRTINITARSPMQQQDQRDMHAAQVDDMQLPVRQDFPASIMPSNFNEFRPLHPDAMPYPQSKDFRRAIPYGYSADQTFRFGVDPMHFAQAPMLEPGQGHSGRNPVVFHQGIGENPTQFIQSSQAMGAYFNNQPDLFLNANVLASSGAFRPHSMVQHQQDDPMQPEFEPTYFNQQGQVRQARAVNRGSGRAEAIGAIGCRKSESSLNPRSVEVDETDFENDNDAENISGTHPLSPGSATHDVSFRHNASKKRKASKRKTSALILGTDATHLTLQELNLDRQTGSALMGLVSHEDMDTFLNSPNLPLPNLAAALTNEQQEALRVVRQRVRAEKKSRREKQRRAHVNYSLVKLADAIKVKHEENDMNSILLMAVDHINRLTGDIERLNSIISSNTSAGLQRNQFLNDTQPAFEMKQEFVKLSNRVSSRNDTEHAPDT